jgi:non-specific serine/threonine protein kinase/serine/threonine-protein kinase
MDPARWERMWALYEEVVKRPKKGWSLYLRATCPDDAELRAQVKELLSSEAPPESFLEAAPGVPPPPPLETDTLIGESIGPYRIMARLGSGGMGVVYEAEQERPIRRRVALKLMRPGLSSRELLARFESERQALALVSHAHIAKVFDVGATDDGRPFFVMERVEGPRITDYCDEQRLTIRQRLELFLPVCDAVQHAHQKGILHRDLKPSNIVVATDNGQPRPMIIDFGVSKLLDPRLARATAHTRTGSFLGTPEYMSPEQWDTPGDVDSRADVNSLGVTLYELLTGSLPLELRGKSLSEAWRIQREQEPERPSTRVSTLGEQGEKEAAAHRRLRPEAFRRELAGDLDWIVMRALEKERERRYGAASELAADIERHLRDLPVLAGPPSRLYRGRKFVRRHRVAVAAAVAFGVALLAGLAGTVWMAVEAAKARDEAQSEAAVAQATSDFLEQMFSAPDPYQERSQAGVETKVVDVLDQAARDLDSAFPDQPLVEARLRRVLGGTYTSLRQHEAAKNHLRKALRIQETHLGPDHLDTVETRFRLAHPVWAAQSGAADRNEYLALYRSVYESRRRQLGAANPETLEAMQMLAEALRISGHKAELGKLATEALVIYRQELQEGFSGDPRPMNSMDSMAVFLVALPETERAPLVRQFVERRSQALGEEHEATFEAKRLLAFTLMVNDEPAAATEIWPEVIEHGRRRDGNDRHNMNFMNYFAYSLLEAGRLKEAEDVQRELLSAVARFYGIESPNYRGDERFLGSILLRQGRVQEAEALFRRLLSKAEDVPPPTKVAIPLLRADLGRVLTEQGRYDEAEKELLKSYGLLEQAVGAEDSVRQLAIGPLIELYEAWGKPEKAAEFRALRTDNDPS